MRYQLIRTVWKGLKCFLYSSEILLLLRIPLVKRSTSFCCGSIQTYRVHSPHRVVMDIAVKVQTCRFPDGVTIQPSTQDRSIETKTEFIKTNIVVISLC